MARQTQRLTLAQTSPGTERSILLHRYGDQNSEKKAYIQAAIHTDEIPALLVAHHLVRRLDELEAEGRIVGEIMVVPYANPIGLDQFVNGRHNGRNELAGGGNFNRNWPDLSNGLAEGLEGKLGNDEAVNIAAIRGALRDIVAKMPVGNEFDSLRKTLASLAIEAEVVLDLHCDDDALMHLYMLETHSAEADTWGRELASTATLVSDDSGGGAFDETFSVPWLQIGKAFPDLLIPAHCKAATVELRGQGDVFDEINETDAEALCRILRHQGFIEGGPIAAPAPLCEPTLLSACEVVESPGPGVLSYCAKPGDRVRKGDVIAWLVDPYASNPEEGRTSIHAGTDGLFLTRLIHKYVRAGESVAKIVGKDPLPGRETGSLLEA